MKKIILSLIAVALSVLAVNAQDMSQATEIAKTANEALGTGDNDLALKGFKEALGIAEQCGDEGAELVATCKDIIPQIMLQLGKDQVKAGNFDAALEMFKSTIDCAKEYGVDEVIEKATSLIPDTHNRKASSLAKAGDVAGAIEAYKEFLALEPENGAAALQLGNLYVKSGDLENAETVLAIAIANGKEKEANKLLSNSYLKKAQASLKANKLAEAIADCEKSNSFLENANAYKLAASAASKLKKNNDAIGYYEKYLEIAPDAKDVEGIICTVAVLYQQAGNKAKAKEYYTKIVDSAQYGATAKEQLKTL